MAAVAGVDIGREEGAFGALLDAVLDGQARAIDAVRAARGGLARAAECVAAALNAGGRVIYLGVGASAGLLAGFGLLIIAAHRQRVQSCLPDPHAAAAKVPETVSE